MKEYIIAADVIVAVGGWGERQIFMRSQGGGEGGGGVIKLTSQPLHNTMLIPYVLRIQPNPHYSLPGV